MLDFLGDILNWAAAGIMFPLLLLPLGFLSSRKRPLLLWILILAIYGGVLALGGSAMPMALKARILAVQGMVTSGFLAFSLFTSNPFLRLRSAGYKQYWRTKD